MHDCQCRVDIGQVDARVARFLKFALQATQDVLETEAGLRAREATAAAGGARGSGRARPVQRLLARRAVPVVDLAGGARSGSGLARWSSLGESKRERDGPVTRDGIFGVEDEMHFGGNFVVHNLLRIVREDVDAEFLRNGWTRYRKLGQHQNFVFALGVGCA